MIPQITAPNTGSGLRASWGASVAGAINALAAGLETRAKPLENQRNRRGVKIAGPFEPQFETKKNDDGEEEVVLKSVGEGLIPWGRTFIRSTPEVDLGEAAESDGLFALEITHPVASDLPTAKVKLIDGGTIIRGTDTETYLPLYQIEKGSIKIDYRCYLALAIRE